MKKSKLLLERSKDLRKNQTEIEAIIWAHLRNKRMNKFKFRRQQQIGPYIVDFICFNPKVIIECDGSQHALNRKYDIKRDKHLTEEGFTILRFWNNEILENKNGVLNQIYQTCHIKQTS